MRLQWNERLKSRERSEIVFLENKKMQLQKFYSVMNNFSTILYLPICTKMIELQKSGLLMERQNEHVSIVVNAQQKSTALAIIIVRYVVVKLFVFARFC